MHIPSNSTPNQSERSPELDSLPWYLPLSDIGDLELSSEQILFVGFPVEELVKLRGYTRDLGVRVSAATMTTILLSDHATVSHFSYLIVNLEAFNSVNEAVTSLCTFRSLHPGIIVVLCSHNGSDDYGTERAPIGDVTIRLPCCLARFKRGLRVATVNFYSMHARGGQCCPSVDESTVEQN